MCSEPAPKRVQRQLEVDDHARREWHVRRYVDAVIADPQAGSGHGDVPHVRQALLVALAEHPGRGGSRD